MKFPPHVVRLPSRMDVLIGFLSIAAVLFPFFYLPQGFFLDWTNHHWLMRYFAEYSRDYHSFPDLIVAQPVLYAPGAIFQGYLFYPLLVLPSLLLGVKVGWLVFCVFLFTVQYVLVHRLIEKLGHSRQLACCVSVLVTWSIYPLSDLYNRGALPEFSATVLVMIAVVLLLSTLIDESQEKTPQQWKFLASFCVCSILILGFHPITAVCFMFFVGVICLLMFKNLLQILRSPRNLMVLVTGGILCFVILLPWWQFYREYSSYFLFLQTWQDQSALAINGIDSFWRRFSPVLLSQDTRIFQAGIDLVATPFLDTQVLVQILILLGSLLFFRILSVKHAGVPARTRILVALLLLVFTSVFSLSGGIYEKLPQIFSRVQFVHRVVTYQNLSIFLLFVFILKYSRLDLGTEKRKTRFNQTMVLVLSLAGISLFIKHEHVHHIRKITEPQNDARADLSRYPNTYYGFNSFANQVQIPEVPEPCMKKQIELPVSPEVPFKTTGIQFKARVPGWYCTNIARSVMIDLLINQTSIAPSLLRGSEDVLALWLEPGTYQITVRENIPPGLLSHKKTSLSVFIAMMCGFLLLLLIRPVKFILRALNQIA